MVSPVEHVDELSALAEYKYLDFDAVPENRGFVPITKLMHKLVPVRGELQLKVARTARGWRVDAVHQALGI